MNTATVLFATIITLVLLLWLYGFLISIVGKSESDLLPITPVEPKPQLGDFRISERMDGSFWVEEYTNMYEDNEKLKNTYYWKELERWWELEVAQKYLAKKIEVREENRRKAAIYKEEQEKSKTIKQIYGEKQ